MLAILVLGLIFLAMVALTAVRPRAGMLTTLFFAPWSGLDVDLGIRITVYQVALAAVCLVTLARSLEPGWRVARPPVFGLLLAFVVYGVVWSMVQIAFVPKLAVGDSVLRGPEVRATIQVVLFLFALAPVLLVPWWLPRLEDLRAMWRVYITSAVVLAVIGWIQLAVWYGTGTNPMRLGAFNTLIGGAAFYDREGFFKVESLLVYRMNSFGYEPRFLGVVLALAMLLIQAAALTTPQVRKWWLAGIWLFLLISAALTFSTSAVLLWGVGSAMLLPGAWLFGVPIRRSATSIAATIALFATPLVLGVAAAEAAGYPVIDVLSERTIERLTESGAVEDFDLAILDYLEAHPMSAVTGVGIGNAHLYAMPYVLPEFLEYTEGMVFIAKTQYLKFISEIGVIGFGLFLLWYARLVALAAPVVRHHGALAALPAVAVAGLAVFLATIQITPEAMLLMGALAAAAARPAVAAAPRLAPTGA